MNRLPLPSRFFAASAASAARALLLPACALLFAACDTERAGAALAGAPSAASPSGDAAALAALPADAVLPGFPAAGPDGKVRLTEAEWRARLSPEEFRVLRGSGTERPFSCELWKISDTPGTYHCAGCGLALFRSTDKFESGTGWPSFTGPIAPGRVLDRPDHSHGMVRVENVCARCDGHLGHVFPDGPPPGGLRYCINGVALRFAPDGK